MSSRAFSMRTSESESTMNHLSRGPWQTILRVVTLAALVVSLIQVISASTPVRAEDPTAPVQSAAEPTESITETTLTKESATEPPPAPAEDIPTETPTSEPTIDAPTVEPSDDQPPSDGPTEEPTSTRTREITDASATDAPTVTSTPTDAPTTFDPATVAPASDTATTEPTSTSETMVSPSAAAIEESGVRVTIRANDFGGPGIPNVCITLTGKGNAWNDSACTDEHGQANLHVLLRFDGSLDYRVLIQIPPGYAGDETLVIAIPPGAMVNTTGVLVPVPPVDQTLRAVDAVTNDVVGGVCWTYFELQPTILTKGDLLYGPTCDTNNDGATIFAQTPPGSYCVEVTPPTGWRTVTGQVVYCGVDPSRGDGFRVALVTDAPAVSSSVVATIKTAWGTAVPEVCAGAVVTLAGGGLAELGTACSDASGKLTISKLPPGSYALQWRNVPGGFRTFADVPFTIVDTTLVSLTVTLENDGTYDAELNAVAGFGPAPVPGVCWTMKVMDVAAQKPTSTVVVGPVCDADGDGQVVLEDVPSGSFCFAATPPKGWYRPDNRYEFCKENLFGYEGTLGFIPTPAGPKPSPTPSPTPFPQPDPICSTTVSRTISAFYGTLTDENGDPISTELYLSDHIPQALRDAIANGGTPQGINALFEDWVNADLADDIWGESGPEGLDPLAALTSDYVQAGNDVTVGSPRNAGSETYSYTSYRWIDGGKLPPGCFIPASFAPLYPISQTTEVTIDYAQLNASLGENPSPNPSPTPKPTKTPTPHHGGKAPTASATEEPVTALPNTGTSGIGEDGHISEVLVLLSLITVVIVFGATKIRSSNPTR